ncbi:MAG TPA: single-stranded DNA-binding protein, partial [bacterium (Candidatus Stahlbacteria)]|nr:single-stranded DNA-binding protein [Candidatus Stahlbacteria bacterium]
YTPKGVPVCSFRIAVSRRFKDRETGDFREDVAFLNCVAWRRLAEQADTFLKKGSAILIEGRLRSRSWETGDGQRRSTVEVVARRIEFLDKKAEEKEVTEEVSLEPTEEPIEDI